MARIRTVKPEFPQSESMGRVSRDARLLFIMLWTICDDYGKARGHSRALASLLFPYDEDAPRLIEGWMAELEAQHCIILYTVNDHSYLQIKNWGDHQKIDHPSKSKFPDPPTGNEETLNHPREPVGNPREPSRDVPKGSRAFEKSSARTWTKEGTKKENKEGSVLSSLHSESTGVPPLSSKVAGIQPEVTAPPEPPKPVAEPPPEPAAKAKPAPSTPTPVAPAPTPDDPWAEVYARGKQVLGRNAGGLITNLKLLYDGKPRKVAAKIEDAAEQREPREWMVAFLLKADDGGRLSGQHIG